MQNYTESNSSSTWIHWQHSPNKQYDIPSISWTRKIRWQSSEAPSTEAEPYWSSSVLMCSWPATQQTSL